MLRTLYAKLAAGLVLLLVGIGAVYALLSLFTAQDYLRKLNQEFNRDLARNLVAERNLVRNREINHEALEEAFHHYMVVNPSIEIYLLSLDGTILSYSADPAKVKRDRVSVAPIRAFLSPDAQYPLLGDDPRDPARRKEFSVTPVPTADSPEGYLYVILRGEEFDLLERTLQGGYFLRLSGWTIAGSLAFGLLAGLAVFRLLTRRVHRLAAIMDDFRRSDFTAHIPFAPQTADAGGDEVDRLGATFDQMAEHIVAQLEALKRTDMLRRELVAHVSHDLRTPLATLHGYLETLQIKDGGLTPEQRAEYVSVALRHSERLRRLVEALFELAKLDAKDTAPQCEPFSMTELAQDVVQKWRLKAGTRDVVLALNADDDLCVAYADVALVERVLENLVENALEHTPGGGQVAIRIRRAEGHVLTEVADTGSGIPPEELPRIFDRFYQAHNKHRGNEHAGLGLAIAKRILELHDSRIEVGSRVGAGTTFSFTLPVAPE
ncbi:MAG: HAMP domain-containing protein [Gammaproteobacteria bacterium]|nr:HAMP domain-containing protein [Gammaproteobacteria bacterium]NIR84527.1 HAMP domain-containing protein [Gammaproteobacteria bacterium]NIR90430.1 HAMP domain-containing protein [Gammaproteobacteria bacterium]NIU05578.1 HAMP domain-containing protein [Gammaproteobacteria bacterium]NIV52717.1 HAMP domain-containing protein [Gammaproteobacteria bacterium]